MKNFKLLALFALFHLIAFAQPGSTDGIYFNGTSNSIIPSDTKYINNTTLTERTIEGWFKVNNGNATQVIYKEGGGIRGIVVYVKNNYLILGAYNNADYNPKWLGTYFKKPITNNTWYHFALSLESNIVANNSNYNVNNNTNFRFYLNGSLQIKKSGYKMYAHNGDITIGSSQNGTRMPNINSSNWITGTNADYIFNSSSIINTNNYFKGRIFGLRVWNSIRTLNEINDNKNELIYNVGEDNLVGALLDTGFLYLDNSDKTSVAYKSAPKNHVWLHGTNTVWSNSSNWNTNGVPPNIYDKVVISSNATNFPVLTNNIYIGELSLENNTIITVSSGVTLTIAYKLSNKGKIIVEDGGSFVFEPNLTVEGNFEIKRDSPVLDQNFYSYWSTPVIESDANPAIPFIDYPNIYGFNANQNPTDWFLNSGANFIPGNGYAVRYDNATPGKQEITFNGVVNNGNIDVELFYNPSDVDATDFGNNLLGNPYPSALNWKFFNQDSDNADILNGTVYIWSQSVAPNGPNLVSDYITCTNSGCNVAVFNGQIASGQGFFVNRKDPTTNPGADNNITFKNSHRIVGQNQYFRNSTNQNSNNQSWFKMTKDNLTESIYVGFRQDATNEYDDLYDGIYNNTNVSLGFYSLIENDKMAVQTLSKLTNNTSVALGYRYNNAGTITITLNKDLIDANFDIILENTYTNQFTDLRNNTYSFNVTENIETEINDQFIIHYRNTVLSENDIELNEKDVIVYTKNNYLHVNAPLSINNLIIYDINGRLIANKNQDSLYVGHLTKGVYLVNITLENKQKIFKKVIL